MPNWNVFDKEDGQNHIVAAPTGEAAKAIYKQQKVAAGGLQAEPVTTAGGLAKSAASGVVRGLAAIPGLPGDAYNLLDAGVRNAPRLFGYPATTTGKKANIPTTQDIVGAFERNVTPLYQPQTTAENIVGKIGEYGPGIAMGPGGLLRRVIQQDVAPAIGEEVAGEVAHKYAPQYEPVARMAGSFGGSVAAGPAAINAFTPNPISPLQVQHAKTLRKAGIDVSAGAETGNYGLRIKESELGRGGAPGVDRKGNEQFTSAVMAPVGDPGVTNITPDVLNANHARIGGVMDRVESSYAMNPRDRQFKLDMRDAWNHYSMDVGKGNRAPIVEKSIRDMLDLLSANVPISADIIAARRTTLRKHIDSAENPATKKALLDLREAIDDAMERSMIAQAGPQGLADIAAWKQARRQYANLMIVEEAWLKGQAENRGMGYITPTTLAGAAASGPRAKNFIKGRSDYTKLALAGQAILSPLGTSNTAARSRAGLLPATLGLAGGATLATLAGHGDLNAVLLPALGAAGGAGLNVVAGKTLMHPWTQKYLRNQLMGPEPPLRPGRQTALTAGLYGPRLAAPVLTIGGDEDGMMTPEQQAAMRRRLANRSQ